MKRKLLMLLFAGAIMIGVGGCEPGGGLKVDPRANCWVFVSTIPGEETILLAKSGLTTSEAFAIEDDFKKEYGKNNVWMSVDFPGGINDFGRDHLTTNPDAVTNCYEITMILDFSDTSVPSKRSLLDYGFRGVRINDHTVIGKKYTWAYTDEMAEECLQFYESSYNSYGLGGAIISSGYENLGPEVHNEPIIF